MNWNASRTALFAIALACSVQACKKNETPKEEPAKEAAAEPAVDAKAAKADTPPAASTPAPMAPQPGAAPQQQIQPKMETKLVSKGKAPLREIHYGFKQGQKNIFSLQQETLAKVKMNGQAMPGSEHPFQISMLGESEVVTVAADGSAERITQFTSITPKADGAPPQMLAQLEANFQAAVGIKIKEKHDKGGELLGLNAELPLNAPPQLQQLLASFRGGANSAVLPFPAEKLGVGAQWTSSLEVDQMGKTFKQVNTFTITKISGDNVELKLGLDMSAPPQKMTPPGAPPGTEVEIEKFSGKGEGTLTLNLKTLEAQLNMKQVTIEKTNVKGSPQGDMTQESETTMTLALTQKAK